MLGQLESSIVSSTIIDILYTIYTAIYAYGIWYMAYIVHIHISKLRIPRVLASNWNIKTNLMQDLLMIS